MSPTPRTLLLASFLALCAPPVIALEGTLEAGIGLMGLYLPDYRGSDNYQGLPVPFPYIHYEGPLVQIGREGMRARVFALERVDLTVSISASPPASGDGEPPRDGMPELLPIFELGPQIDIELVKTATEDLKLRFPARAVLASDFTEVERAGWLFEPHLNGEWKVPVDRWSTIVGASVGALWGTADYHEYFYGVAPEFARPGRPAYAAEGGYSGARANLSWNLAYDDWKLIVFTQYDRLDGAVFEESPLVQRRDAVMTGLVVMYRFYSSAPGDEK